MTRLLAVPLLAIFLTACEPTSPLMTEADTAAVEAASASAGCDAEINEDWNGFATEALTFGPTCPNAVAALVVRTPQGTPLLAWSSPAMHIFGLKDAADRQAMEIALSQWIRQDNQMFDTTADLPEWADGARGPGGEFPFMPEEWIDRSTYQAMRTEDVPLFSFPQGMESLAVYLLRDGQLEPIGIQTFPG